MSLEMLEILMEWGLEPKGKAGLEKFFVRSGLLHYEKYQLLEYLLTRGLDPNPSYFLHLLADAKPKRPATDNVAAMVASLLKNGADPHLLDYQGRSPLQIAQENYKLFKRTFQRYNSFKPSFKNVRTFRSSEVLDAGYYLHYLSRKNTPD